MNNTLKASQLEISEQQLDRHILRIVEHMKAHSDHCLYIHFGGFHRSQIKAMASTYSAEIKMLRRYGPFYVNWLAFLVAGHEALLKIKAIENLPNLIESYLKTDGIVTIAGFAPEYETSFLAACRKSIFIDFGPEILGNDPTAFVLQFVFPDPPLEAVRWVYKGERATIDFD